MAERGDRPPVGQPRRRPEHRPRTAGDGRDRAASRRRRRGSPGGSARSWSRRRFGGERDPRAVGRPGRLARPATGPSVRRVASPVATSTSQRWRIRSYVKPGAVEHVVEPVDEAVVGRRAARRAWACASMPRRAASSSYVAPCEVETDHEPSAVGRPLERLDAARQVGQPARLAGPSSGRRWTWSSSSRSFVARSGRSGSSSTWIAPVREERERPAVGREPRVPVVAGAERELARLAVGVRRSARARARGGSRRSRARRVWSVTTAQRPSGERRGSVAMRRRYRSSGRGGRGTAQSIERPATRPSLAVYHRPGR